MPRTPAQKKTVVTKNSTAERALARLQMIHAQAPDDTKRDIETVIRDIDAMSTRSADIQMLVNAVREMTRKLQQQPTTRERKKRVAGPDAIMKRALFEVCVEQGMSVGVPLRSKIIKHADPSLKAAIKAHAQRMLLSTETDEGADAVKMSTVEFIEKMESKATDDVKMASAIQAIRATLRAFHRMKQSHSTASTQYDLDMVDGCMTLLRDSVKRTELEEVEEDGDVVTYLEKELEKP